MSELLDPRAPRPSVPDISQALDSLRERLNRLERASGQAESSGRAGSAAPAEGDPQVLAVVQDILSIPSSVLNPGELFTLAIDRVSRLCAADRAMLFVADAGGGRLVPRSAHGFRREDLESISIQPGEGIVGRAFKERRVLTYTGGGDEEAPDSFIERFPVRDAIAVPVRAEDELAGVLYTGRRRLGAPFSANDILLLLVIADRVGGGLVHQALLDRRGRHVARLAELGGFAGQIRAALPLTEVLAHACEAGCRLVDVRAAAVAVAAETGELELVAARGLPGPMDPWRRVNIREGLTAELDAGNGPVACRDVQSRPVPERSFLGDGGFHGCLLLPLRLRGDTAGVLYLADTEVRDFSAEEIEAAQVLAVMVTSAIENCRAGGELRTALEGAQAAHERLVQVEKARALGEMAGGLARELNNIFAVILGKSRLLLGRSHDEPLREGLGVLEEAAWRGADVVQRLAAMADRHTEIDGAGDPHLAAEAVRASPPPADARHHVGVGESEPRTRIAAEPKSGTASVLVLEDDAPVRSLLVAALTQAGHTVETALDGPSGLAKLEGGHFDVVLTDLALPQRSGLAIARSVKRLHPHTPVVLITGWGHLLDPERLREHGVDLMLVKPFRLERVLSVVGDALRLRTSS